MRTSRRAKTRVAAGVIATLFVWGPTAHGDEPEYVDRDGRRVPTKIVPPTGKPAQSKAAANPAPVQATQQSESAGDAAQPDALAASEPDRRGAAAPPTREARALRRRSPVREFAPDMYGYGYRGWRSPLGVRRAVEDAYWAGRLDERDAVRQDLNLEDMNVRRDRLEAAHALALDDGLSHLAAGSYREAAVALTRAARLDQSDPACRIHLAQAQLALRHYRDAGATLRRALELQPELALYPLGLERVYGDPSAFDAHVAALTSHVSSGRPGVDELYLLGFMEFQRGNDAAAHAALVRVVRALPRDQAAAQMRDLSQPAGR